MYKKSKYNMMLFGSGSLELTTWFKVSVPLLVVSYAILFVAGRGWFSRKTIQRLFRVISALYENLRGSS